jgi:hypothetical protein
MKKLLLICLALVVSLTVVLTSVTPVAARERVHRPQPQNCGQYLWCDDGNSLDVWTCNNQWSFDSGDVDLTQMTGGVRQYGNLVVVRWSGIYDGTNYSFYAIGVIDGPAVVYIVGDENNDGYLEKYTYNLDSCKK